MVLAYRKGNGLIGLEQYSGILSNPWDQLQAFPATADFLGLRQTHRMLFESFDTEQLETDGRFIAAWMLDLSIAPTFSTIRHGCIPSPSVKAVLDGIGRGDEPSAEQVVVLIVAAR
jgi:hypothetical protein